MVWVGWQWVSMCNFCVHVSLAKSMPMLEAIRFYGSMYLLCIACEWSQKWFSGLPLIRGVYFVSSQLLSQCEIMSGLEDKSNLFVEASFLSPSLLWSNRSLAPFQIYVHISYLAHTRILWWHKVNMGTLGSHFFIPKTYPSNLIRVIFFAGSWLQSFPEYTYFLPLWWKSKMKC